MVDFEKIWRIASQNNPDFRGLKLSDMGYQCQVKNFTLTTGAASNDQPMTFAAGSVIGMLSGAAQVSAQAGTTALRPGLDMFSIAITDNILNRAIVGKAQSIASAVFGRDGTLAPFFPLIVTKQGTLNYSVTNLTTSTITISCTAHVLVPLNRNQ